MTTSTQTLDRHQLKTLLRTSLILDWRGTNNPFSGFRQRSQTKAPGLVVVLGLNMLFSLMMAGLIALIDDTIEGIVLSAALAMCLIAFQVVLEFGNTLVTATDYDVISPHPVSSKTFYVAKILHALVYVTILSSAVIFLPALVALIARPEWWAAPGLIAVFWTSCVFVAVLVMNLYTLILKRVDRQRLEQVLGLAHMVLVFAFILGMQGMRLFQYGQIKYDFSAQLWFKLIPSYWYAAPLELLSGRWSLSALGWMAFGAAVLVLLGRTAVSYLSLSYAESLTRLKWTSSTASHKDRAGLLSRLLTTGGSPEDKALMLLIRKNFRHDAQFRMGVVAFIPLLIFYLIYGFVLAEGAARDPLAPLPNTDAMTSVLFGLATIISPFMVLPALQGSKEWRAAWIFMAAPIDRLKMVLAMTRFTERMLLLPLAVVLAPLLGYLYGDLLHAAMHTILLVLLAQAGVAFINWFSVKMPFSHENTTANYQASAFKPMIVAMVTFGIPMGIVSAAGYFGYYGWACFVGGALILRWLLRQGQNRRILKKVSQWEFAG
jgi:hypothetical protein